MPMHLNYSWVCCSLCYISVYVSSNLTNHQRHVPCTSSFDNGTITYRFLIFLSIEQRCIIWNTVSVNICLVYLQIWSWEILKVVHSRLQNGCQGQFSCTFCYADCPYVFVRNLMDHVRSFQSRYVVSNIYGSTLSPKWAMLALCTVTDIDILAR